MLRLLPYDQPRRLHRLSLIRRFALSFGLLYLGVTVLGITPMIGGTLGSEPSWVLGVAPVNLAHNVLHGLLGLIGVLASTREGTSRAYARLLGLLLVALGIAGLTSPNPVLGLPLGGVDFLLHILSGGVALYYGFAPGEPAQV
jgi:uncharacterized membrane protein